jgi:hypothetical protein
MIIEISFTVLFVWVILKPQSYIDSMNEWNHVFGGNRRDQPPLWLVRLAGAVLLSVCWFAFISSRLWNMTATH